ncbi:hypothetical protein BJI67_15935 (plasmid) [Acidihalobacter aeolianus]|uniref:Uncharacterized protein n=1 Tax=Acidihalobacter aeolianus TaxID=2792603 RepID=A0A1D8KCP8_9GAMM|nr:hypothetical protein [Acidihalobacter aeolianus]AOV18732.1 hypothetical protein BJI67_15935 [Acidihalobacter aeolianus]
MGHITEELISLLPDTGNNIGAAYYRDNARRFFGALEALIPLCGLSPTRTWMLRLAARPESLERFSRSAPASPEREVFCNLLENYRKKGCQGLDLLQIRSVVGGVVARAAEVDSEPAST